MNLHNIHQDGSILCQTFTCLVIEEIRAQLFQSLVAHSMTWCFVHKCNSSFPDKYFVTGRFQVRFVQNKSEIALQCDLALSLYEDNNNKLFNQTSGWWRLNPHIDYVLKFFRTKKLSPSDRSVWCPRPYTIFKLLLSARFCSAFLSNISDCDETFNYWEPVSKARLKLMWY